MHFQCQICFGSYTDSGTEHAPYSGPCGHVMGKSCMKTLKEYGSEGEFNCPFCNKRIVFELCHPIYLMPDEFFASSSYGENHMVENKQNSNSIVKVEMTNLSKKTPSELMSEIDINITQPLSTVNIKIKGSYEEIKISNRENGRELINGKNDGMSPGVSNCPYCQTKMKQEGADVYPDSKTVVGGFESHSLGTSGGIKLINLEGDTENFKREIWVSRNSFTNIYSRQTFSYRPIGTFFQCPFNM
uniref:RING-type domain-containing protein n=1 Tax=Strongyloides papillosus TaxID=174720 RepID=A0A0N5C2F7_STREA